MAKEQWQGPSTVGEKVGVRSIPAELHWSLLWRRWQVLSLLSLSLSQSHPFPSSSSQQPKTDEADGNPFPSLRLHLGSRAWPSTRLDRCKPISAAKETTRGSTAIAGHVVFRQQDISLYPSTLWVMTNRDRLQDGQMRRSYFSVQILSVGIRDPYRILYITPP